MSLPAFYLPPADWKAECLLTGDEARHFLVLRIRKGDNALILDGQGRSAICRVIEIGRRDIRLEMISARETPRPESRPIIAIALSKAARRGFFLEKAAELGAWQVWLWQAERSQGHIDAKLLESCRAQLRAGAKQCHNPWFPELVAAGDAASLSRLSESCQWRVLPWEARAGEPVIGLDQLGNPGDSIYALGPEGGLTDKEAGRLIEAGFAPASLGERVLRCETAATLCLGLHWWAFQYREGHR